MAKRFLVVLDCVTLVQGLISKSGPAVRCLELFDQGKIAVAISKETLGEFRQVIGRSSLRRRYPSLADERVDQVMRLLVYRGSYTERSRNTLNTRGTRTTNRI